jgi:hypothetical protein
MIRPTTTHKCRITKCLMVGRGSPTDIALRHRSFKKDVLSGTTQCQFVYAIWSWHKQEFGTMYV